MGLHIQEIQNTLSVDFKPKLLISLIKICKAENQFAAMQHMVYLNTYINKILDKFDFESEPELSNDEGSTSTPKQVLSE